MNLFPFFYFLEKLEHPIFEFVQDVPARLNKKIRAGEIDVSPSSSVEYLMNDEIYEIIDGHSISSTGPVRSIILFSKIPIDRLRDKTILVTDQSDTSIMQLEIIMNVFLELNIKTIRSNLSLYQGLEGYPAYLLIGDDAMSFAHLDKELYLYDLGQLWQEYTGLPFVYALWIVRKDVFPDKKELIDKLKSALDDIKTRFLQDPSSIAHLPEIANIIGRDMVVEYWKSLSYDLNEEHKEGLRLFKKYMMLLNQKRDSLSCP